MALKLGFWSALLAAVMFLIFTVCFILILATSPLFFWTDLPDYLLYVRDNNQTLAYVARFCSLLFAPLFVVVLNSLHEIVPSEKQILTRNSLSFGLLFAMAIGIHYFVQLTAVRLSIQAGQTVGLEQVVQANPISAIAAINMLGWTLFLGLSSLFLVPIFGDGRLQKIIKVAFLVNGVCCLVGGVSYIFQWLVLLFLMINLGMGGALTVAMIGLALYFRRLRFEDINSIQVE